MPSRTPAAGTSAWDAITETTTLEQIGMSAKDQERLRIVSALERCAGNQSQAARLLGMSRRTLINRIEEYGLPRPRKRDDDDDE
jgi:DNA-binding NtrC family response regulator